MVGTPPKCRGVEIACVMKKAGLSFSIAHVVSNGGTSHIGRTLAEIFLFFLELSLYCLKNFQISFSLIYRGE